MFMFKNAQRIKKTDNLKLGSTYYKCNLFKEHSLT